MVFCIHIISNSKSNTIVSAYTTYRYLQLYCTHPLYAKHSNILPIRLEHKTPETGLKLVALILLVNN